MDTTTENGWIDGVIHRHEQAQQHRYPDQRWEWEEAFDRVSTAHWLALRSANLSPSAAYNQWAGSRVLAKVVTQ